MIKNVINTVDFLCKNLHIDCEVSNAEDFILSIGEEGVLKGEKKLARFKEVFTWEHVAHFEDWQIKNYEDFLEYFNPQIGWKLISKVPLSSEFMDKHKNNLNWINISRTQKLTEEMMERFSDNLDWKLVSFNQSLSEPFMEKHSEKLDWLNISLSKKLSREFILKHEDKLNMTYVNMKSKDSIIGMVKNLY